MFPSIKWSRTHKLQCRKMYQLTVQYEEGGFHKWWVKIGGAATRHINTCRTYHLPPIIPPFVTYQHCHRWGWSSQRWWSRWNDDGNSTTILLRMFQMKCLCSNQIYLLQLSLLVISKSVRPRLVIFIMYIVQDPVTCPRCPAAGLDDQQQNGFWTTGLELYCRQIFVLRSSNQRSDDGYNNCTNVI